MAQRPGSGSSSASSPGGAAAAADTSLTKIFVGGLAWETQCDSMRCYFEQFGEIVEAVVIVDKHTGRSKGYGFVTFREPDAARRACANPAPFIDGRRTNCNLAVLGAHRHRTGGSPLFPGPRFLPVVGDFSGQGFGGAPPFGHPLPFAYHHPQGGGYPYPSSPLGYPSYPPEYYAPPNIYNQYIMGNPHQITGAVYQPHVPPSPTFQHLPAHHAAALHPAGQHAAAEPFANMPPSPLHFPSYFLPPPFVHSPGHVSPSGSQGPSTPRLVLQAPPFTPGGGPDHQSSG